MRLVNTPQSVTQARPVSCLTAQKYVAPQDARGPLKEINPSYCHYLRYKGDRRHSLSGLKDTESPVTGGQLFGCGLTD